MYAGPHGAPAGPTTTAPPHAVGVAVSGGRDSLALLHATCASATSSGVRVVALHVHHGLQPEAERWLSHVRTQCERWAATPWPLSFACRRLEGTPAPGDSVEAWARRGRYRALAEMAGAAGAGLVLLAHHRQDQAETFLLQALRGGGPAGLAAMPRTVARGGVVWARPWIDQPRAAIDAYVREHRIAFVDDPSNAGPQAARSRLRDAVMPALEQAFGGAASALAAAARRAAEAQAALDETARADLAAIGAEDPADGLPLAGWTALTPGRRANALRAWLGARLARGATQSLVERLQRELVTASAARWPAAGGELRLYRGVLRFEPGVVATPNAPPPGTATTISILSPGLWAQPAWAGAFEVTEAEAAGLRTVDLLDCELRPRCGGERWQRGPQGRPAGLKRQYQQAGTGAWDRAGPLVYARDGRLLFVPGLGVDARWQVPAGDGVWTLRWRPGTHPSPHGDEADDQGEGAAGAS